MEQKQPDQNQLKKPLARIISAGIIIFRHTPEGPKFLLLYHGRNYWNFPKGKLELDERSFDAALREVEEETGIKKSQLRIVGDFKTQERFIFQRGAEKMLKIVILYLAETNATTVVVSHEHEGYAWFTYAGARRVLIKYKDSTRILKNAYEFIHKGRVPGSRAHPQGPGSNLPRSGAEGRTPPSLPSGGQHLEPQP